MVFYNLISFHQQDVTYIFYVIELNLLGLAIYVIFHFICVVWKIYNTYNKFNGILIYKILILSLR